MAKKAAPKAAEPKAAPAPADKKVSKPKTKGEIFAKLAETTGLTKKQISSVFDGLSEVIKVELGKKGPGLFVIPGLLKLKRITSRRRRPGNASIPSPSRCKCIQPSRRATSSRRSRSRP